MEERERIFGQPKEATSAKARVDHVGHTGPERSSGRGSHGSHTAWAMWPLATLSSRTLPHVLQPYLEHPNSDFESVFRFRIVTPSHMTTTNNFEK